MGELKKGGSQPLSTFATKVRDRPSDCFYKSGRVGTVDFYLFIYLLFYFIILLFYFIILLFFEPGVTRAGRETIQRHRWGGMWSDQSIKVKGVRGPCSLRVEAPGVASTTVSQSPSQFSRQREIGYRQRFRVR